MRKITALMLALVMVLSISACGGKKSGTPEASEPKEEVSQGSVPGENEAEPPSDEDITETPGETEDEAGKEEEAPPVTGEDGDTETSPEPAPEPEPPQNGGQEETVTDKTAGNILLDAFKAEDSSKTALELAEELSKNPILPFAMEAISVSEGELAGFDAEINGFKEGAVFRPIISAIPFVGYVFTLESAGNASAFINTLKSNANLRWNVCSEAEEMVSGSVGNKVFFIMTNKDLTE